VKITFEELVNGTWKTVVFEGKEVEEIKETSFTTGNAPDHIPASNVAISYPIPNQGNFYPREYNKGYIELRKGQPDLFTPGPEWTQSLFLVNSETEAHTETSLAYDALTNRIHFDIPPGLQNGKPYKIEILNIPRQTVVLDANVQNVEQQLSDAGDTLTTKKIEGDLAIRDAKTVYSAAFRTSKFNTFRDKMGSMTLGATMNIPSASGAFSVLRAYLNGDEAFDNYEVTGMDPYPPLVTTVALLDNAWYETGIFPLVYDGYPLLGFINTSRDTSVLGLPPVRAAYVESLGPTPAMTDIETDVMPPMSTFLYYDLMQTTRQDFASIQRQVADAVADKPGLMTERIAQILTSRFPFYRYGKYGMRMTYRVPGTNITTSMYDFELFNTVRD